MSFTPLITAAAEGKDLVGINSWVVGGTVFALFLIAMLILLSIGGGREHS